MRTTKSLPTTMQALELRKFGVDEGSLALVEKPLPQPGDNEVLVRIKASPVNPSDLMFLRGLYVQKKLPVVPGFEASGEVVATGGGFLAGYLRGKRVACVAPLDGDGTWADYMTTPAAFCIPLLKSVDLEQAASLIVNPFTAWALLDIAVNDGAQAVVQTAAASALGRMLNRLARRRSVAVINVVRRDEQGELLRSEGATEILNSSDSEFDARLRDSCQRLGATVAFDAVAGEMTGRLLTALERGGRAIVYGALSQQPCAVNPRSLIFEGKRVEGFWLSTWLPAVSMPRRVLTARRVQKLLASDLRTEVRARLPLSKAAEGLREYVNDMTGGKILLMPGLDK